MKKILIYLASPYTHKDTKVCRRRYKQVSLSTIHLLQHGIHAFSPINYNGGPEWTRKKHQLPIEWHFWEVYDKNFLDRCDALVILTIDGWDKSVGVAAEIEYAKDLGMPVFYKTTEQILSGDLEDIKEFEVQYTKGK